MIELNNEYSAWLALVKQAQATQNKNQRHAAHKAARRWKRNQDSLRRKAYGCL